MAVIGTVSHDGRGSSCLSYGKVQLKAWFWRGREVLKYRSETKIKIEAVRGWLDRMWAAFLGPENIRVVSVPRSIRNCQSSQSEFPVG
jgi:hypothetical protein